jgi:hypothetical protein
MLTRLYVVEAADGFTTCTRALMSQLEQERHRVPLPLPLRVYEWALNTRTRKWFLIQTFTVHS